MNNSLIFTIIYYPWYGTLEIKTEWKKISVNQRTQFVLLPFMKPEPSKQGFTFLTNMAYVYLWTPIIACSYLDVNLTTVTGSNTNTGLSQRNWGAPVPFPNTASIIIIYYYYYFFILFLLIAATILKAIGKLHHWQFQRPRWQENISVIVRITKYACFAGYMYWVILGVFISQCPAQYRAPSKNCLSVFTALPVGRMSHFKSRGINYPSLTLHFYYCPWKI